MMDPRRVRLAVALVYDQNCPNVDQCRAALRAALSAVGALPVWNEWDRNSAATPEAYRGFGSPTVLVNGRDICGPERTLSAHGNSCRIYLGNAGRSMCGAPSVTTIVNALLAEQVVCNA
jgi:mercuric ion transport protein